MRDDIVPRAMNGLLTAALLGMMGLLSWGVAALVLGPRVILAILAFSMIAMAFRIARGRGMLRRQMGARPLAPGECAELQDLVAELARAAGLRRTPEVWWTPAASPNAHAFGTRHKSLVAVSEGLLRALKPREVASVIAHEVAHIRNGDLWIMQAAQVMQRALSLIVRLGKIALVLAIPFVLLFGAPFPWQVAAVVIGYQLVMAALLQAVSRVREIEADRGAAAITGDPESAISALERVDAISPPGFWARVWPVSLFNSHPALADRITHLRRRKARGAAAPAAGVMEALRPADPAPVEPSEPARAPAPRPRKPDRPIPGDCPF